MFAMVIVAGVALYLTSSISGEYAAKKREYDESKAVMLKKMELLGKVNTNQKHLAAWDKMMRTETRGTFLEHLKKAERKFAGSEITKTSHNWLNYSEGIGKGISQPASQVTMTFLASYRAMQTAFMEMETMLPQMQLDSLEMSPDDGGKGINFKTTFTVWTLK